MKYYPVDIKCECGENLGLVVYHNGNIVYECQCGNSKTVKVEECTTAPSVEN